MSHEAGHRGQTTNPDSHPDTGHPIDDVRDVRLRGPDNPDMSGYVRHVRDVHPNEMMWWRRRLRHPRPAPLPAAPRGGAMQPPNPARSARHGIQSTSLSAMASYRGSRATEFLPMGKAPLDRIPRRLLLHAAASHDVGSARQAAGFPSPRRRIRDDADQVAITTFVVVSAVDPDPLPKLRIWHAQCARHDKVPPASSETAVTPALAIGTIQRLEACERRHRALEEIVETGRRMGMLR